MYEMDNVLKLVDVINDPVALDQFLEFPVDRSVESQDLDEVISNTTGEDLLNFETCHLEYPSVVDGCTSAVEWNSTSSGLSSGVSRSLFDSSMVSSVDSQTAVNVSVVTLPLSCGTVIQNSPVGRILTSTGDPQGRIQIQPLRNNLNIANQLSGSAVISDNSVQRLPFNTNKVLTNFSVATSVNGPTFIVNSAGNSNGSQVLMNVQPQSTVQNNAVHVQYVQVQNQHPSAMSTGAMVQSLAATQLPSSNLKPVHGGVRLQGTIMPTAAGNRVLIRTGIQPVPGANTGQVNVQPVQLCESNFVGGTLDPNLPRVIPQVAGVQKSIRVQQPQVATLLGTSNNSVAGQVTDASLSVPGGRQVFVQRSAAVSSQNVICHPLPQQQMVTVPVNAVGSQDYKLPDGLVVQFGGQTYRFKPSQQSTGATDVGQSAVCPQSQNVGFSDGSGVSQDPVTMLQRNVHLQQMLIGNQINVLQMLQTQQQQQSSLQPQVAVQQFSQSQVPGSSHVITNSTEVTSESNGNCIFSRAAVVSQPLQTQNDSDPLLQRTTRIAPGLRTVAMTASTTTASTSRSGLQFIQPKPVVSIGIPRTLCSGVVSQPLNLLPLGTRLPVIPPHTQQALSDANMNGVSTNVQPPAPGVVTTLSDGAHQIPRSIRASAAEPSGHSQPVTTVLLSTEQQNLLMKIQAQMKTLVNLPKRNPDQEKYLQMLISGQQRLIGQGVSQYLQQKQQQQQQMTSSVDVGSVALSDDQRQQQNVAIISQPPTSTENDSVLNNSTATGTEVTDMTSIATSMNSTSLSASSSLQSSGQVKLEDLFRTAPHLKEKLESHLAKMSPEQRQWFVKNQSVVLAKLQQHQRLLLEQDTMEPSLQQHSKPLTSSQPQKNSSEASSLSEATATRIVRSLHLTRAQKFHLYLQKDQKRATQPEYSKAFENFKDVIRGLVPFHVFQTREQSEEELAAVEEMFEEKAQEMLERKDSMLRKYRFLLLEESMRPQLTSELVLLERAFHSDEKTLLTSEKRQAEEDPDSFVPKPVLKRLKVEDEDIKKEDENTENKDPEIAKEGNARELNDLKVETASLGESVIKHECDSNPSSPANSVRNSPVERRKVLQIKLEKLDDTEAELAKYPNEIEEFDSIPRDEGRLQNEESHLMNIDNFENSESTPIPTTTETSSGESFTEDDAAVASLLGTNHLSNISSNFDTRYANEIISNDAATSDESAAGLIFDNGSSTFNDSANADFKNSFVNVVAEFDSGDISNEQDNDVLVQGTIDSLVADLTQFNYDLSKSSWGASEPKGDESSSDFGQIADENALSKCNSTTTGAKERPMESLQYEMQCAIDSILRLQQPWSDDIGTTTRSNLTNSSTSYYSRVKMKNQVQTVVSENFDCI